MFHQAAAFSWRATCTRVYRTSPMAPIAPQLASPRTRASALPACGHRQTRWLTGTAHYFSRYFLVCHYSPRLLRVHHFLDYVPPACRSNSVGDNYRLHQCSIKKIVAAGIILLKRGLSLQTHTPRLIASSQNISRGTRSPVGWH